MDQGVQVGSPARRQGRRADTVEGLQSKDPVTALEELSGYLDQVKTAGFVIGNADLTVDPPGGFVWQPTCYNRRCHARSTGSVHPDGPAPGASNALQVRRVVDTLLHWRARKLGFLGLSFKGGTDDLRESPIVDVVETMLGKGYDVRIYDPNVSLARLFGANKEYIEKEIPHIDRLMCKTLDEVLQHAEVLIVGNHNDEFRRAIEPPRPGQRVLDLVRLTEVPPVLDGYEGICW